MEHPSEPLTLAEGFRYLPAGAETGFLEGPDGSRAGLHLEFSPEGPFIARLERPAENHWGVYRVGLRRPIATTADLVADLLELLPKLKILYQRIRVQ